jgi:rhodanese-related sulfurtransferase
VLEDTEETQVVVATISREDLKDKLDRGDDFILVETLPEEQYRHAHLPSAVNLPPDRVRERAPEVLPDKDADIVVYCGSPK